MAAVGGPTSWSLTVQWDGTTFVDESQYVLADGEDAVEIRRGRGSEADDVQSGTLAARLNNARADIGQLGRFTHGNPLSALWPNVRDGARVRFEVTRGGVPSMRHRGRLSLSSPDLPGGAVELAEVSVLSVDALGQADRRSMLAEFVERWRFTARTAVVDIFPLPVSSAAADTFANVGSGTGTARIIRPLTSVGSWATEDPDTIVLDSALTLTPQSGVGPVLFVTSPTNSDVQDVVVSFRTAERTTAGGPDKFLVAGKNASGATIWSLRLKDNAGQTDVNLYDANGSFVRTCYFGFAPGGGSTDPGDDQWFLFRLFWDSVNAQTVVQLVRVQDRATFDLSLVPAVDVRATRYVVLGGSLSNKSPGKQTGCVAASFGAVVVSRVLSGHDGYLYPYQREPAQTRVQDMALYNEFAYDVLGSRNRQVYLKPTSGRTGFDMLAELCRTTGGVVVARRDADDAVRYIDADQQRLPTVRLAVSLDLDVDGQAGLPTVQGGVPSRVTARWQGGEVVYEDTTQPLVVDDTIDTCAADDAGALDVASAAVNSSRRLRIRQLTIDLATADTDLWSAVMALEIGDRIRVTLGTASSNVAKHYGVTYVDVYAVGWVERYGRDSAKWVIDTVPADDPAEGIVGDLEYGRLAAQDGAMTATAGTLSGTAGTGTVVVTTLSGPTLSTVAADYPQDFTFGGERVTVASPPASAVSPQTVTVTARGVAPSIAKVHAAGEAWNIWRPVAVAW